MRNFGFDPQRSEPSSPEATAIRPGPSMPAQAAASTPAPRQTPAASATSAATDRKVAVLGPTLRFKGELSADEDFILQGRLEGSINHTQSVTIGTDGVVQGNIHARVVTIDGAVEGDLHGTESVVVHATGRVTGNIFAPRVGLIEGAFFSGRIEMPQPATRAAAPTPGVVMSAEETARILGAKS